MPPRRISASTAALDTAFRRFCRDDGIITAATLANAGETCGYHDWLETNNKLRFGVDNRLTRHAVLGAMLRLRREGSIGPFFYFLHANEHSVMEELGISETDPLRIALSQALANAIAEHPGPPPKSRGAYR